jgi:hypothetical protein
VTLSHPSNRDAFSQFERHWNTVLHRNQSPIEIEK